MKAMRFFYCFCFFTVCNDLENCLNEFSCVIRFSILKSILKNCLEA